MNRLRFLVFISFSVAQSFAVELGQLNAGINAYDSREGEGYILFNPDGLGPERTHPSAGNASNFIAVVFQNGEWFYDDSTSTLQGFSPVPGDLLVAKVDFSENEVTLLSAKQGAFNGIFLGYKGGDLAILPQRWNGGESDGDFELFGSQITLNNEPHWWLTKGILSSDASEVSQKAVVNLGQAKWMVKGAIETLEESSPGIAAEIVNDLSVGPNAPFSEWPPVANGELDRSPLLIGQLKAISAPFYHRLNALYPQWLDQKMVIAETKVNNGSHLPWGAEVGAENNRGTASIGQLKATFFLPLSQFPGDVDSDGLVDDIDPDPNDPHVNELLSISIDYVFKL